MIASTVDEFYVTGSVKEAEENVYRLNNVESNSGFNTLITYTLSFLKKRGYEIGSFAFEAETNVPKQAGLGGSTAIIVNFLKNINEFFSFGMNLRTIAHYGTLIEHEELGITAGPQDRFIITFGGTKYMDFTSKNYEEYGLEEIEIKDLPFYIGVRSKNVSSGDVHKFPYSAYLNSPELQTIVQKIKECAVGGRKALLDQDFKSIGSFMKKNQELTQEYGKYGNPNSSIILQRRIDQELLDYCNKSSVIGVKLGGSSGSVIVLSEERPDFLLNYKPSQELSRKLAKIDPNPSSRQINQVKKLVPGKISS